MGSENIHTIKRVMVKSTHNIDYIFVLFS